MEKLNFKQLEEILSEIAGKSYISLDKWMQQDIPKNLNDLDADDPKELFEKLGEYEIVEEYGGEGEGDDFYTVYHFKDHGVFIKFQGWYASSMGSEFEDLYEVTPEEKLITVYNKVN